MGIGRGAGPGGARAGAGRKTLQQKYGTSIGKAERSLGGFLPEAALRLLELANGIERIEEKRVPARSLTRKGPALDKDGKPLLDGKGKAIIIDVPLYPDAGEDDYVVTERKIISAVPDLGAIVYAMNRVMGPPVQKVETEHSGDVGIKVLRGVSMDDL